jgi:hypothetical protein
MNTETNDQLEADLAVEREEAELETIATALQVRSGIPAGRGLQPCI